jgi:hypothetical protein
LAMDFLTFNVAGFGGVSAAYMMLNILKWNKIGYENTMMR